MFSTTMKKDASRKGLDPVTINYLLKRKGYSQARLARDLKMTRSNICNHIAGRRTSRRVRKIIARKIGLHFTTVWGSQVPAGRKAS